MILFKSVISNFYFAYLIYTTNTICTTTDVNLSSGLIQSLDEAKIILKSIYQKVKIFIEQKDFDKKSREYYLSFREARKQFESMTITLKVKLDTSNGLSSFSENISDSCKHVVFINTCHLFSSAFISVMECFIAAYIKLIDEKHLQYNNKFTDQSNLSLASCLYVLSKLYGSAISYDQLLQTKEVREKQPFMITNLTTLCLEKEFDYCFNLVFNFIIKIIEFDDKIMGRYTFLHFYDLLKTFKRFYKKSCPGRCFVSILNLGVCKILYDLEIFVNQSIIKYDYIKEEIIIQKYENIEFLDNQAEINDLKSKTDNNCVGFYIENLELYYTLLMRTYQKYLPMGNIEILFLKCFVSLFLENKFSWEELQKHLQNYCRGEMNEKMCVGILELACHKCLNYLDYNGQKGKLGENLIFLDKINTLIGDFKPNWWNDFILNIKALIRYKKPDLKLIIGSDAMLEVGTVLNEIFNLACYFINFSEDLEYPKKFEEKLLDYANMSFSLTCDLVCMFIARNQQNIASEMLFNIFNLLPTNLMFFKFEQLMICLEKIMFEKVLAYILLTDEIEIARKFDSIFGFALRYKNLKPLSHLFHRIANITFLMFFNLIGLDVTLEYNKGEVQKHEELKDVIKHLFLLEFEKLHFEVFDVKLKHFFNNRKHLEQRFIFLRINILTFLLYCNVLDISSKLIDLIFISLIRIRLTLTTEYYELRDQNSYSFLLESIGIYKLNFHFKSQIFLNPASLVDSNIRNISLINKKLDKHLNSRFLSTNFRERMIQTFIMVLLKCKEYEFSSIGAELVIKEISKMLTDIAEFNICKNDFVLYSGDDLIFLYDFLEHFNIFKGLTKHRTREESRIINEHYFSIISTICYKLHTELYKINRFEQSMYVAVYIISCYPANTVISLMDAFLPLKLIIQLFQDICPLFIEETVYINDVTRIYINYLLFIYLFYIDMDFIIDSKITTTKSSTASENKRITFNLKKKADCEKYLNSSSKTKESSHLHEKNCLICIPLNDTNPLMSIQFQKGIFIDTLNKYLRNNTIAVNLFMEATISRLYQAQDYAANAISNCYVMLKNLIAFDKSMKFKDLDSVFARHIGNCCSFENFILILEIVTKWISDMNKDGRAFNFQATKTCRIIKRYEEIKHEWTTRNDYLCLEWSVNID